tara:strand:+ start:1212 stop:1487 length:276 start_codon:yes stop_codon:yes gene_type:complete
MGNMSRKIKRNKKKKAKKELATKVALFGKLGDACMTCDKPFDKKDKEQVMSWSVVVREQEEKVNLYCPECWDRAKTIVEEFKKHLEDKNDS